MSWINNNICLLVKVVSVVVCFVESVLNIKGYQTSFTASFTTRPVNALWWLLYTHSRKKLIMCIGKRWCVSVFYFCFSFKCIYTFLLLFCVVIYLYFVMLHVCLMYSVFIYSIRHESIGGISLVVDDIDAWLYSNSRLFSAFALKTRRKMSGKWNVWTASDAVELFSNIFNFIINCS